MKIYIVRDRNTKELKTFTTNKTQTIGSNTNIGTGEHIVVQLLLHTMANELIKSIEINNSPVKSEDDIRNELDIECNNMGSDIY